MAGARPLKTLRIGMIGAGFIDYIPPVARAPSR